MLNIELLRATQRSIANEENTFDMADWGCCIAGHALACARGSIVGYGRQSVWDGGAEIAHLMGLPNHVARILFIRPTDRQSAIEALERLIVDEQHEMDRYAKGVHDTFTIPLHPTPLRMQSFAEVVNEASCHTQLFRYAPGAREATLQPARQEEPELVAV